MPIQLSIRHGSPDWWASPAIWVVPGTDPNGSPGAPIVGQSAYLWATVNNEGDAPASQVQIDFWVANPSGQIRKSTANHIGTSFADIAARSSQDVLCLAPWAVSLFNGGHECIVVEATSPTDPLQPPPADPDVLDGHTYRQIAQHNLNVISLMGLQHFELLIGVVAGERADRSVELSIEPGRELPKETLERLGLRASRHIGLTQISATLSPHSLCGADERQPQQRSLRVHVPRRTSAPVYLGVSARQKLKPEEYAVLNVVEREQGRILGGLSAVLVDGAQSKGDRK